ncbi:MAG TPA: L-histidine N(alpha)-methyltransferase, partial [Thermoanaerobaculia bacterium]
MLDRPKVASRERFIVRNAARRGPSFAEEVREGLTSTPKSIPPRYFYDALGSAL